MAFVNIDKKILQRPRHGSRDYSHLDKASPIEPSTRHRIESMAWAIHKSFFQRPNSVLGSGGYPRDTGADWRSHDLSRRPPVLCKPFEVRKGTRWDWNDIWTGGPFDLDTIPRIGQLWTSALDCLGRPLLRRLRG